MSRLVVPKKEAVTEISWLDEPEEHDYPAAYSYLNLIFSDTECFTLIKMLKFADMAEFKAKDIFRASELSLLGISNSHVDKNIKKINNGKALSPILLVRNSMTYKVIIADGYHRLCCVYHFNEDALIPCKIVTYTPPLIK